MMNLLFLLTNNSVKLVFFCVSTEMLQGQPHWVHQSVIWLLSMNRLSRISEDNALSLRLSHVNTQKQLLHCLSLIICLSIRIIFSIRRTDACNFSRMTRLSFISSLCPSMTKCVFPILNCFIQQIMSKAFICECTLQKVLLPTKMHSMIYFFVHSLNTVAILYACCTCACETDHLLADAITKLDAADI